MSMPEFKSPTRLQRAARRLVLGRLRRLERGTLWILDALGPEELGDRAGPAACIEVHDPVLWTDVLSRGVLGAGEAYAAGAWSSDDLPAAVQVLVRNRSVLSALDGGLARLARPLLAGAHRLQRNSRAACRRFISAHYDLGNEFFALFLDPTMTYSAGVFEREDATLEEASIAKYDRLANKLGLEPGMRVLEIGCGWGGFAEHAASHYGCHVTATTISDRQYTYARDRVAAAGLARRVDVQARDYRDLRGRFDRVVSIEMVEAIGHRWIERFAKVCQERLTTDGLLALQAITIDDRQYERARRSVDFIKRYIFPGSFIPSTKALHDAFVRATDMRLLHLEDIGLDYARTLAAWRASFLANREKVRELGFSDGFVRLWDYYFAYCEGGFRERVLGDVQMILARPQASGMPWRPAPSAVGSNARADLPSSPALA